MLTNRTTAGQRLMLVFQQSYNSIRPRFFPALLVDCTSSCTTVSRSKHCLFQTDTWIVCKSRNIRTSKSVAVLRLRDSETAISGPDNLVDAGYTKVSILVELTTATTTNFGPSIKGVTVPFKRTRALRQFRQITVQGTTDINTRIIKMRKHAELI